MYTAMFQERAVKVIWASERLGRVKGTPREVSFVVMNFSRIFEESWSGEDGAVHGRWSWKLSHRPGVEAPVVLGH